MWRSQIRLSDEVISRVRELSAKRGLSLNRTIEDLLRAQLVFLGRCESGEFRGRGKGSGGLEETGDYEVDYSDSQV